VSKSDHNQSRKPLKLVYWVCGLDSLTWALIYLRLALVPHRPLLCSLILILAASLCTTFSISIMQEQGL
jgi:hypothetical protein